MSLIMAIKPKLITFDVTGTLLKFRMPVEQQYANVGSSFGVKADPNMLKKQFKIFYKQMMKDHPNFGEATGIGWESWWKQLVKLTFKNALLGTNIDNNKMETISSRLIDIYRTSEGWEMTNGVVDLLDYLKKKHIPVGVISNYDTRLEEILEHFKLLSYFDFVISSYKVKLQKPDKNIFKIVEEMNLNIKPDEILHVGDSVESDYFGARNAGWNAVLVNEEDSQNLKKLYPEIDTNYVVKDLTHLKNEIL